MKSAETKAEEFCELYQMMDATVKQLTNMFKDHERDTKEKAIEEIQACCRKHVVYIGVGGDWPQQIETVSINKVIGIIQDLEVG